MRLIYILTIIMTVYTSHGLAGMPPALMQSDVVSKEVLNSLQPHKALYKLSLKKARTGSQILDISGQMMFEWEATCEGWVSNHRFDMTYTYADQGAVAVRSDFSTFETFDGKTFNFTTTRKSGDDIFQKFQGSAVISSGGGLEVTLSQPKQGFKEIKKDMLFPVQHTLQMLDKVLNKKKFYNAFVFDGSDEKGAYEINAFFAGAVEPLSFEDNKDIDEKLVESNPTKARLAFFAMNQQEERPEYEMNFLLHHNGVVSDMLVEYPDFEVRQALQAIEPLAWPECGFENE